MNIAVLCNHLIAVPAIETLLNRNSLAGLAVLSSEPALLRRLSGIAQAVSVPLLSLERAGWVSCLRDWLSAVRPDAVFVLGFPYRIPGSLLRIPPLGFINFHPGHLPRYRGPLPLYWQIRNREPFAVLSIHRMDARFDSGPVVHEEEIPIDPSDTYGLLMKKLFPATSHAAEAVLAKWASNQFDADCREQDESRAAYQPAPGIQDLLVDWNGRSAPEIDAMVRAGNPVCHGAVALFAGVPLHVGQVTLDESVSTQGRKAGEIVFADLERGIGVCTADQHLLWLDILSCDDGCFSGKKFVEIYGIRTGELFQSLPRCA